VKVWEAGSGRLLRTLEGHKSWVTSVAVTPDGRAVVSRDSGRKDYRWNLATGARSHASSKDKALLTAIRKRHRGLRITGGDLHLAAPDGSSRACLITLPGGHWIALLADGLTYTGSDECEAHMQVVEGFEARDLDADFIAAHRRDKLDIDWP
jgi:WD40 repeat protein